MQLKEKIKGFVVKIEGKKPQRFLVERKVVHPRYRKIVKRFKKYLIHDERNEVKVGDTVVAVECRPLSKRKSFRLKSVLATGVE